MDLTITEQFKKAQEMKDKDINSYVWKGARTSKYEQIVTKLIDSTEEQLNTYLAHCNSMLHNTDKDNPGRYVLLDILQDQRHRCNAELFLRWQENTYEQNNPERNIVKRSTYLQSLNIFLTENSKALPDINSIDISDIITDLPTEFEGLPLNYIIDGCRNKLGRYNKKHMTLKFIVSKLGMWFSQDEMREFTEESKKLAKSRIELVKERCGLSPNISIVVNDRKSLNFKEFRALVLLNNKSYNEMTTDQLLVLRDKGLYELSQEVLRHIDQWIEISRQIKEVATLKGYIF